MQSTQHETYWQIVWKQFRQHKLGLFALMLVIVFCLIGLYAPFLASSKPLVVYFDGNWYFPLFRYLFFTGFYTKRLDIFYNLFMFTFPLLLGTWFLTKHHLRLRFIATSIILIGHFLLFLYLAYRTPHDPAANGQFNQKQQTHIQQSLQAKQQDPLFYSPLLPNWEQELAYLTPYAKLNLVLRDQQRKAQDQKLRAYAQVYLSEAQKNGDEEATIPSLWEQDQRNKQKKKESLEQTLTQTQALYQQASKQIEELKTLCSLVKIPPFSQVPSWLVCLFLAAPSEKRKNRAFSSQTSGCSI